MPTASSAPAAGLHRQIAARVRTLWFVKMAGTTAGIGAFFVAYFWVLQHPFFPVTTMPLTAPDHWIAFRPEAFFLYVSLWVYVSLAPALMKNGRELAAFGATTGALSVAGLAIFVLWPTAVPAFALDWSAHPSLAFLKTIDVAGNACPSLHVAFAVFTAFCFERLLREMGAGRVLQALNLLWCLGIAYSTVAIRQHVALDVLAGALLGVAAGLLHARLQDRAGRRTSPPAVGQAAATAPVLPR